jgi:hypothetical protein
MTMQITVTRLGAPARVEPQERVTTRLTLGRGEVFRVPRGCRSLYVLSGTLWLTHQGRDMVRGAGPAVLPDDSEGALISGLGGEAVVIEFNGADETWLRQRRKTRFWTGLRRRFDGRRSAAMRPSA